MTIFKRREKSLVCCAIFPFSPSLFSLPSTIIRSCLFILAEIGIVLEFVDINHLYYVVFVGLRCFFLFVWHYDESSTWTRLFFVFLAPSNRVVPVKSEL